MKKNLSLLLALLCAPLFIQQSAAQGTANEDSHFRIPLIGESAPAFIAESTNGTIHFPSDFGSQWKVLISHPQDFTPVCSTEILELAYLQNQFDKMGVKLIVVSTDLLQTHYEWKQELEKVTLNNRQPIKIAFPLVDDKKIAISKQYGMIHSETNSTKSVRGVFIIDPNNIIQAIYFYPMKVGRNIDELVRMISALQITSKERVMTPANWKVGNDLMIPFNPDIDKKEVKVASNEFYSPAWFMWFKKVSQE